MTAQESIARAYSAFNERDVDAALALMGESVSWPKASEGGRVVGKQGIREYWTRQWAEFDARVDVIEMIERGSDKIDVKVHQLVKNIKGDVLSDTELCTPSRWKMAVSIGWTSKKATAMRTVQPRLS